MRDQKLGAAGIDCPMIDSPLMFPMTSGQMSVKARKGRKAQTFENESIVRLPDVVKDLQVFPELKKYKALIISENVNRVLVIIGRTNFGYGPIRIRMGTFIELGIFGQSKTFLTIVMAKEPKNVWQLRLGSGRLPGFKLLLRQLNASEGL